MMYDLRNKSVVLKRELFAHCFGFLLNCFQWTKKKEVLMSGRGLSSIHHTFIGRKGVTMNSYEGGYRLIDAQSFK
ncbi:hypothetical protein CEXT_74131 [Caerostris extrusa]|uniref:Uncharacterized protein n=1 Tax=Caerostris extrusa TaxID=172846 RepID=A0AAV4UWS7_CAEEX|nr:hypothetical protein CEXT_74131 [Caerostris extrusa]